MSRLIQIRTKASEYDGEFRWQAAGMSYLFVNEAHEYAVIDGGRETGDIDELYRLMREDCGKTAERTRSESDTGSSHIRTATTTELSASFRSRLIT